ncbi:acetyl-CoA acetyltransferase [Subtercola lobariae]|uniref:Acetyl-CoA acetyltransferase n=2 Tax=Subtercola lobariae TaxID=1588641 RepID=A0A917BFK7_9MICO|nr:acetyl-CoA acetyltransferase [Subtercola lobariae]
MRADDLTVQMVRAALAKVPELDPADLTDLMLGCGLPGGEQGQNMGRNVAVLLGYDHLPGTTITRYCSSSLQTTRMAFHAIKAGEGDAYISAGVEAVSRFTKGSSDYIEGQELSNQLFADAIARTEEGAAGGAARWTDPRADGLIPDVYIAMGQTAENVQQLLGMTRREQDDFAVRSQNRAEQAILSGFWANDISPVILPDGSLVSADDCPRPGTTLEGVSGLQPVFRPDGTVTAGNACPLNDGAAALVVMSDVKAKQLGITPLARIVSTSVTGLSPEIMGLGPVGAIPAALKSAGMSLSDIDLFEINEAFAVQALGSAQKLGIEVDRLNVNGGAIAVGHPFGMTGARITSTLINALRQRDAQFGVESMCVGGGMGMAMVIERLS